MRAYQSNISNIKSLSFNINDQGLLDDYLGVNIAKEMKLEGTKQFQLTQSHLIVKKAQTCKAVSCGSEALAALVPSALLWRFCVSVFNASTSFWSEACKASSSYNLRCKKARWLPFALNARRFWSSRVWAACS